MLDARQTLEVKRHPEWMESNVVLGRHPGDAKVIAYFASVGVLTGVAWYALPRGWRVIVPMAVLAAESWQIYRNARLGVAIRL